MLFFPREEEKKKRLLFVVLFSQVGATKQIFELCFGRIWLRNVIFSTGKSQKEEEFSVEGKSQKGASPAAFKWTEKSPRKIFFILI